MKSRTLLVAVAITTTVAFASSGIKANALTFDFSFSDLSGTVTGEVDSNNVTLLSIPSYAAGFTTPISLALSAATIDTLSVTPSGTIAGNLQATFTEQPSPADTLTVTLSLFLDEPGGFNVGSLSFQPCV